MPTPKCGESHAGGADTRRRPARVITSAHSPNESEGVPSATDGTRRRLVSESVGQTTCAGVVRKICRAREDVPTNGPDTFSRCELLERQRADHVDSSRLTYFPSDDSLGQQSTRVTWDYRRCGTSARVMILQRGFQHRLDLSRNSVMLLPGFPAAAAPMTAPGPTSPRSRSPPAVAMAKSVVCKTEPVICKAEPADSDCVPLDLSVNGGRLSPGLRDSRDSGTESDDSGGRCTPEGGDCTAYKKSLMKRYCKFLLLITASYMTPEKTSGRLPREHRLLMLSTDEEYPNGVPTVVGIVKCRGCVKVQLFTSYFN